MKRQIVSLLFIPALFLTNGSSTAPPRASEPKEIFVADCELILFGREIDRRIEDGRQGYRIVRTETDVLVNDVVFFSAKTSQPQPAVRPEIQRASDVIEAAAAQVQQSRDKKTGVMAVGLEQHKEGDSFALPVPAYDATATVTLGAGGSFCVAYEGHKMFFDGVSTPDVGQPSPVDASFHLLAKQLLAGRLVVAGKGYLYFFPLSRAQNVRASLAKIANAASTEKVDETGVHYKPLSIDGYDWDSSVVRDFSTHAGVTFPPKTPPTHS